MVDFSSFGDDNFNTGYQNAQQRQLNDMAIANQKQSQQAQQAQQKQLQEILVRDQTKSAIDISQDMIKAGMIDQGGKLLNIASQAQHRIAEIDNIKDATEERRQQNNLKSIQHFSSALEGVQNQDDYNNLVRNYESMLGQKLPDEIHNARWTPEYKQRLQNLGITYEEQIKNKLEQQRQSSIERNRQAEDEVRKAQIEKNKAQTQEIKTRTEHLEKNQGKTPRLAKEDIQQASDIIAEDFPKEGDSASKANAAYTIASRADKLLQSNRGLDRAQAIQKVYNDMKKNGELTPQKETPLAGLGSYFGMDDKETGKMNFKNKDSSNVKDASKEITQAKESFLKSHPGADLKGAEKYLKDHPEFKNKFKNTFGYLPEDIGDDNE